MMRIRDLSCGYGRKTVLEHVSLDAAEGECIGITGLNGSGKSTLLKVLAGVDPARSGEYRLCGYDMLADRKRFGELIGYVPQEDPLLTDLSVSDNLKLWSGSKPDENAELLGKLRLNDMLKRRAGTLSGGEKRRLSVACALTGGQKILVMDEPTSALDLRQKEIIRQAVRALTDSGGLVIMATHDIMEIEFCDRIYYLSDRSLKEENAPIVIDRLMKGDTDNEPNEF